MPCQEPAKQRRTSLQKVLNSSYNTLCNAPSCYILVNYSVFGQEKQENPPLLINIEALNVNLPLPAFVILD